MSTETPLIKPSDLERYQKTLDEINSIVSIEIEDDEQYQNTIDFCKQVKGDYKEIETLRKETVAPYNEKVSGINSFFKNLTSKLEHGEQQLKAAAAKYFQKKEAKRIAEERKRQAEADEARRKKEEAAQKELDKANEYRESGREDLAEKAEARAEEKFTQASNIVAETVASAPKVAGVSFVTSYECTEVDRLKAAIFCLQTRPEYEDIVKIDLKAAEKLARTSKGKIKIDGIDYRETKTMRSSSK